MSRTEGECPDPVKPCVVLILRWPGVLSEPGNDGAPRRGQLRKVQALLASLGTLPTGHLAPCSQEPMTGQPFPESAA